MEVYAAALIIFLEKNWDKFLKYCGSNDFADETMTVLRKMAGIDGVDEKNVKKRETRHAIN